jgi:ParB family transcriptional regulator, chromosome partitioning protein
VSKRGLPTGMSMRHDSHYVEEITRANKTIGKILPIDKIEPNPDQPRVEIGDLTELVSSIKEKGVLEPLLVKPNKNGTWLIIAGERRWRSANLAGLTEVPCIELDIDEQGVAEIALIENLQRKDLTIWEEADGLAALADKYGYTHDKIAKQIGKSRTTITESMTIAGIPKDVRQKCLNANINAKSTLLEVARQFDDKSMHQFVDKISEKGLKREEVRQERQQDKEKITPPKSKSLGKGLVELHQAKKETFKYASFDNSFDIEVIFNKDSFERKDVLRALKEAFDHVKEQN